MAADKAAQASARRELPRETDDRYRVPVTMGRQRRFIEKALLRQPGPARRPERHKVAAPACCANGLG
jgi:hypothetical protein